MKKEKGILRRMYFYCWQKPILKTIAWYGQRFYFFLVRSKIKLLNQKDLEILYGGNYYDFSKDVTAGFVKEFVQMLVERFEPESVLDVGCGMGLYVNEFDKLGIDVEGFDGSPTALKETVARKELVWKEDIRELDTSDKGYDMALCVEVAEHIPKKYADTLVQFITSASDLVIFSASPKGLGGTNHVNEQPRTYWYDLFREYGFKYLGLTTDKLSDEIKAKGMPHWLWQDIMVFKKNERNE